MKKKAKTEIVQKLNKAITDILATIVELTNLLPADELNRLKQMMDDAYGNGSMKAETIFGLSAIAGFSIAMQVDEQKKEFEKHVARGN